MPRAPQYDYELSVSSALTVAVFCPSASTASLQLIAFHSIVSKDEPSVHAHTDGHYPFMSHALTIAVLCPSAPLQLPHRDPLDLHVHDLRCPLLLPLLLSAPLHSCSFPIVFHSLMGKDEPSFHTHTDGHYPFMSHALTIDVSCPSAPLQLPHHVPLHRGPGQAMDTAPLIRVFMTLWPLLILPMPPAPLHHPTLPPQLPHRVPLHCGQGRARGQQPLLVQRR